MNLKNFKKRLIILFTGILTFIPQTLFAYSDYIIPGGENIGIQINSNGVLVVGTYAVEGIYPARDAGIKIGDKITAINDKQVSSISEMVKLIEKENNNLVIKVDYLRNNVKNQSKLNLIKDSDEVLKTGLYVKDSINGIGTLTFIDPNSKTYGALGHEIIEKTSGLRMDVKDGKIYTSQVTGINKSTRGNPGEKNATYDRNSVLGDVKENTISGIFGKYSSNMPDKKLMKVASKENIKLGKATIMTVIKDNTVENFDIEILKINDDKNQKTKNILFEIIDPKLIEQTGGVVQGMSGSPIIQDEYIIGAVTHVVVDDALKGYGIFITNMLEESEN